MPPYPGAVILLVEDDPGVRGLMGTILTVGGYDVIAVADGLVALEAARALEGRIDVLVTDFEMPGLNGLELATRLLAERPEVKVLMVSGTLCPAPYGETAEWGYLSKPFGPQQLLDKVGDALK